MAIKKKLKEIKKSLIKEITSLKKWQIALIVLALMAIGASCVWLFYHEAKCQYGSDLCAHVNFALKRDSTNYSITSTIYRVLYNHFGGYLAVAIFLAAVIVITIPITKKVLERFTKTDNHFLLWIYAILINFAIAYHIPFIHQYWVVGVQEGNEWHNSTYNCMKPLALLVMLLYFKMESTYLKKIKLTDYILFALLLILVNLVKPNFIVVFAPTMLVFFIIDFFKNFKDKKALRNIVIFGSAVLISLVPLVFQSQALFNSGSEAGAGGVTVSFMSVLKHWHEHPIISLIQSTVFPLFVLLTNLKTIKKKLLDKKDKKFSFVFVMQAVALIQYLFLMEAGTRKWDANFAWGYSFALFMTFIASIAIFEDSKKEKRKYKKAYLIAGYTLLGIHIVTGLIYFVKLLGGMNFS